jgi:predicted  nucleic acid-binding Zn-ribbon protein
MEQAPDNHYMTREFLESRLVENEGRIKQLEEHVARVTTRDFNTAAQLNGIREGMQEWTLEAVEDGSITESQAEEIAEIMGFELTKEFEVEVTVMYSVTVNARNEEAAQNAIYDIDFDTVSYNDESISYLSSSVDRVDI